MSIPPLDDRAVEAAVALHGRLTKPPGSLGRLEALGCQLAGIAGSCPPPVPVAPAVAVFAADHGVALDGVTAWPQEVTGQMVANFAAGGAAINAIARQVGATVHVVDVGVASDVSGIEGVIRRRVAPGTASIASGPAMTGDQARAAVAVGSSVASALVAEGADLLVGGEMGIGNTTAAAALVAALSGCEASVAVGPGAGADDATMRRKVGVVEAAVGRLSGRERSTVDVLAEVGGLEIAALAGLMTGGATAGVPVVVDGVVACAALLVADGLAPGTASRCIAGHLSTEPGAAIALDRLGLEPLLSLDMRLGEGTGACLAVPLVAAAARVLTEMATFDDAGVNG